MLLHKLNYNLIELNKEDLKMVKLEKRNGFLLRKKNYVLKCGKTEIWSFEKKDEFGQSLLEMFENLGCNLKP